MIRLLYRLPPISRPAIYHLTAKSFECLAPPHGAGIGSLRNGNRGGDSSTRSQYTKRTKKAAARSTVHASRDFARPSRKRKQRKKNDHSFPSFERRGPEDSVLGIILPNKAVLQVWARGGGLGESSYDVAQKRLIQHARMKENDDAPFCNFL